MVGATSLQDPMTQLELTLLGGFQARLEPGPPLPIAQRKVQALLAYLAVPTGQAHPRDKLAALLWGDQTTLRLSRSMWRPSSVAQPSARRKRSSKPALCTGEISSKGWPWETRRPSRSGSWPSGSG